LYDLYERVYDPDNLSWLCTKIERTGKSEYKYYFTMDKEASKLSESQKFKTGINKMLSYKINGKTIQPGTYYCNEFTISLINQITACNLMRRDKNHFIPCIEEHIEINVKNN
jgi:hypothetical protein